VNDFSELKREGLSIQAISSVTGFDRKTVRKYLLKPDEIPAYGPRPEAASKLDGFKPYLEERLKAGVWNAAVLLRELKQRSYTGGYTILKDWLRPQREAAGVVAVRRFETPPGRQAQVDWGHLGSLELDSIERQLWGFTFTLGYSRMMMAEAALNQKLGTLLRMHEEAFRQVGGVPEEILYDRMKTVWQEIDERGEVVWNPVFLDFSRYWGFTPRLCRPYRAQTKGKVESGVKYVRRNFLCGLQGREPDSMEDLNNQLRQWVWKVANQRVHGTTHELVMARWDADQMGLHPLNGAGRVSLRRRGVAQGGAGRFRVVAREPVLGALDLCGQGGLGPTTQWRRGGALRRRADRGACAGSAEAWDRARSRASRGDPVGRQAGSQDAGAYSADRAGGGDPAAGRL